ncbi:hypothetical protein [Streptomyces sp. HUAS TT7]|uniref:hypothetical protein n=1 Tax=Streptomyces sp. HUAS TT7 TaxID=3447507 RepID=UPI003F66059C
MGEPYPEPYVVVLAVDADPFGVLPRNDGALLALDVLGERCQAPCERRPAPPRTAPAFTLLGVGAVRACTASHTEFAG